MAKVSIEAEWVQNDKGESVLQLRRNKGKFTIEDIRNFISVQSAGIFAIIIDCVSAGTGLIDEFEEGDTVELVPIDKI